MVRLMDSQDNKLLQNSFGNPAKHISIKHTHAHLPLSLYFSISFSLFPSLYLSRIVFPMKYAEHGRDIKTRNREKFNWQIKPEQTRLSKKTIKARLIAAKLALKDDSLRSNSLLLNIVEACCCCNTVNKQFEKFVAFLARLSFKSEKNYLFWFKK